MEATDVGVLDEAQFVVRIHNPHRLMFPLSPFFTTRHLKPMPRHVTLKAEGGNIWHTTILVKQKGEAYFTMGWQEFSSECQIKKGELVVFKYNHDSHFDVSVFLSGGPKKSTAIRAFAEVEHCFPEKKHEPYLMFSDEDEDMMDVPSDSESNSNYLRVPQVSLDNIHLGMPAQQNDANTNKGSHRKPSPYVPHCYLVVEKYSLTPRYSISIPSEFALSELCEGPSQKSLKVYGDRTWIVIFFRTGDRARIIDGWDVFSEANYVKTMDGIAFERNRLVLDTWNVTVYPSHAS